MTSQSQDERDISIARFFNALTKLIVSIHPVIVHAVKEYEKGKK